MRLFSVLLNTSLFSVLRTLHYGTRTIREISDLCNLAPSHARIVLGELTDLGLIRRRASDGNQVKFISNLSRDESNEYSKLVEKFEQGSISERVGGISDRAPAILKWMSSANITIQHAKNNVRKSH